MSKYRKHILAFALVLIMSLVNPLGMNAQPIDPGCDPLDPACPIDGGLSLLIAAGVGLGAKRAYQLKKDNTKKI
jgi:hypothetical protein